MLIFNCPTSKLNLNYACVFFFFKFYLKTKFFFFFFAKVKSDLRSKKLYGFAAVVFPSFKTQKLISYKWTLKTLEAI